jgi:hypothetical protein
VASKRKAAPGQQGLQILSQGPITVIEEDFLSEPMGAVRSSIEDRVRLSLREPFRPTSLRDLDPDHGSLFRYIMKRIGEGPPSTSSQSGGTLTHAMVSGAVPIAPFDGVRRGEKFEAHVAAHPGALTPTMTEHAKSRALYERLRGHTLAAPRLFGDHARHEVELAFEMLGLQFVCHPDVLTRVDGEEAISELKTARSAHPDALRAACISYGYLAQLAAYRIARRQDLGSDTAPIACFLVGIESAPPYEITVFRASESALTFGEKQLSLWVERLKGAISAFESGAGMSAWPEAAQTVLALDVDDLGAELVFPDEGADEDAA